MFEDREEKLAWLEPTLRSSLPVVLLLASRLVRGDGWQDNLVRQDQKSAVATGMLHFL